MDESTKRNIKRTILALRKLLEKEDIPAVLKRHGIFPDRRRVPLEKLALPDDDGRKRAERLAAVIDHEIQAVGGDQKSGIQRYCREVTFTYLNRLIALRSMEVRGLVDECIRVRDDYAGRSLRHHRFLREQPGMQFDQEDTNGLKAFLRSVFRELQDDIKILFDPDDEYSIIMPSLQALTECIRALNEDIPEEAFKEPEILGWVYQYFQTEEKDRVFEEVRTKKKKIEGDDIVPATSLYTERYMVDYLVQNSLGAIWMEMYPDSKLCENWPYFVKDQDLKSREPRPVKSLTFLDPACGSGHFLLVAFDILAQMYEEETRLISEGKISRQWTVLKEKIATTILENNLHGIDIDLRSIQISYLLLYLKMREHQNSVGASKILPRNINLVAADASLLNTPEFLSWSEERFKSEPYAFNIISAIAGKLHNLSEIGSLARPEEDLSELIYKEKERLVSGWKSGQQAFDFYLTDEQRELPFEKITDEQFWEGILSRVAKAIDEYYRMASERGDTRAQVLAHEASRGFKFLGLCNKRYDVVATNPPYIGSKNMGKALKDYVQAVYPQGKRDLYAAFILRNREWTTERGFVAMVTQQSWMFLRSYERMREDILSSSTMKTLAQLGSYCFSDIGGAVVNAVLFIIENSFPEVDHKLCAVKVLAPTSAMKKAELLITIINGEMDELIFKPKQSKLLQISGGSIAYWLSDALLDLLSSSHRLNKLISVKQGLITSDDPRFVRFFWEVSNKTRWYLYSKGGGFCRWAGLYNHVVDWEDAGCRVRNAPNPRVQNENFYFRPGFTYTKVSNRSMGVRVLFDASIIGAKGPGIFGTSTNRVDAMLNSRLSTYLLRVLSPTIEFTERNVEQLPLAAHWAKHLDDYANCCVHLKQFLVAHDLTEYTFLPTADEAKQESILDQVCRLIEQTESRCSLLHTIEGEIEKEAFCLYNFTQHDRTTVLEETGTPGGWHPLIEGYDSIPETSVSAVPGMLMTSFEKHERIKLSSDQVKEIRSRLRTLYEAGSDAQNQGVAEESQGSTAEDEAEPLVGKRIPIPSQTLIEELSVEMAIHPISIYWLLKEMREKERLVCWPEYKKYAEDYFTVMILRMLGFSWPKQVQANEPIPDWTDRDGIIPITEHAGERTLLERIRDRIGSEFGTDRIGYIETEFADILYNAGCKDAEVRGKSPPRKRTTLAQWLERGFFQRHTSQFKKRPIAWHLASSNGTFQVLVLCHRISLDMLKNLKTRYLAKVQSYYGLLLDRARRKETVAGGLTEGKLSDIVAELEEFANKIDRLISMPYEPLIDDGVRVNVAPLQKVGLLASPVLAAKDVDPAIADRNRWREDDNEQSTVWRI